MAFMNKEDWLGIAWFLGVLAFAVAAFSFLIGWWMPWIEKVVRANSR